MTALAGARVLGHDPHADLHRGPPGGVDGREAHQQLADGNRLDERHPVDPRGHDAPAAVSDGGDRGRLVADLHHHAAVHEAGGVRVLHSHPADQLRARRGDRARRRRAGHGLVVVLLVTLLLGRARRVGGRAGALGRGGGRDRRGRGPGGGVERFGGLVAELVAQHHQVLGLAAGDLGPGGGEVLAVESLRRAEIEVELLALELLEVVQVLLRALQPVQPGEQVLEVAGGRIVESLHPVEDGGVRRASRARPAGRSRARRARCAARSRAPAPGRGSGRACVLQLRLDPVGVGGRRVGERGDLLEADRVHEEVAQVVVVGRLGERQGRAQGAGGGQRARGERRAAERVAAGLGGGAHWESVLVDVVEVVDVVDVVERGLGHERLPGGPGDERGRHLVARRRGRGSSPARRPPGRGSRRSWRADRSSPAAGRPGGRPRSRGSRSP